MDRKINRISAVILIIVVITIITSIFILKSRQASENMNSESSASSTTESESSSNNESIYSSSVTEQSSSSGKEQSSRGSSDTGKSSSSGSSSQNTEELAEVRGVWIASVHNIDYPSKPGISASELKREIDNIISDAKDMGLNTIYFQVRPSADALYNSKIFPVSEYLTGKVGGNLPENFDPLKYIVEQGHKNGLKIHAWINPLRVTVGTAAAPKTDVKKLAASHPARKNPDYVIPYADGKLYFDPGIPQVRKLIIDGVIEVVENYDVDGVHFDDYFYPYPVKNAVFDDKASFTKYGSGYKNIGDFRRDNINKLVKGVYDAIKAKDKTVQFGISPFAVWANKKNNPQGSDTNGGIETYYDLYADSRKWVKSNWLDYICPQIYWSMTYDLCSFKDVCDWWTDVTKDTKVKLYVGHAAYKAGNNNDKAWDDPQELLKQVTYARKKSTYAGSIFYGYKNIKENTIGIKDEIKKFYSKTIKNLSARPDIIIAGPPGGIVTDTNTVYLNGWADPGSPVYMSGKKLERTENGYFSVFTSLKSGANIFNFRTDKKELNYKVTYNVKSDYMSKFEVSSPYPGDDTILNPGESITLKVTAPAGCTVKAVVGDKEINLNTDKKPRVNGSLRKAEYKGVFTMPKAEGNELFEIGYVTYRVSGQKKNISEKSKGKIYALPSGAKMIAEVKEDFGWVRESSNPVSLKNSIVLAKGAVDYITGLKDGCYRLKNGGWILKSEVNIKEDSAINNAGLSNLKLVDDKRFTRFSVSLKEKLPYRVFIDDESIKLEIYELGKQKTPVVDFKNNPLISSITSTVDGGKLSLVFEFKQKEGFYGYKAAYENTDLVLYLKNPVKAKGNDLPLSGIKIALNPGHGHGTGALGPAYTYGFTEDELNLDTSKLVKSYLEKYGAEVYMTRQEPGKTTLQEIVGLYDTYDADLALSIHYNSVAYSKDPKTIDGLFVYYSYPHSKAAAETLLEVTSEKAERTKRSAIRGDLYVTRFFNYPSVLAEMGFMSNIYEYEWFENDINRDKAAKALADAVLEHFKV